MSKAKDQCQLELSKIETGTARKRAEFSYNHWMDATYSPPIALPETTF